MMHQSTLLKLPADMQYFPIVEKTLHHIATIIHFEKEEIQSLTEATKELFTNAVIHAYHDHEGLVEIVFHPFSYGIRIDVHDWVFLWRQTNIVAYPSNSKKSTVLTVSTNSSTSLTIKILGKTGKSFLSSNT